MLIYTFKRLLAVIPILLGITADNLHAEISNGPAVGNEAW